MPFVNQNYLWKSLGTANAYLFKELVQNVAQGIKSLMNKLRFVAITL